MSEKPFSQELETWLRSKQDKTLFSLSKVFEEKSFALLILLLMFPSSLPIPTGGVTNLFEIIVMLLCVEMIAGRRTIWLPNKWGNRKIGPSVEKRAIPFIIRRIRWFERFSRPRLGDFLNHPAFLRTVGVVTLIFTLGAFVAPPFLGLDTLPSLGAVVVALSLILEDMVVFLIGCALGAAGVGILIGLYDLIINYFQQLF
jgi:hypothetical protein